MCICSCVSATGILAAAEAFARLGLVVEGYDIGEGIGDGISAVDGKVEALTACGTEVRFLCDRLH